jgi:hypothetical protein
MKAVRAKVVKGKIVTRGKFPDGTKLLITVDAEPAAEIEPDDDDERAFDQGMEEARAGTTIPLKTFRAILHRL